MVKRFPTSTGDSASQRRAAQRRLAREIHSGTYQKSTVGKSSESAVNTHRALEQELFDLKQTWFGTGPNWNKYNTVKKTHRNATAKQLRDAIAKIERWLDDPGQYDEDVAEGPDYENELAFQYH